MVRATPLKKAAAGTLLAVTLFAQAAPAFAEASNKVSDMSVFDDRKAVERGLNIIYEARDLSLPQAQRDGLSQPREDLKACKTRFAESVKRVKTDVLPSIQKAYWTEAREELRRQVRQSGIYVSLVMIDYSYYYYYYVYIYI